MIEEITQVILEIIDKFSVITVAIIIIIIIIIIIKYLASLKNQIIDYSLIFQEI